LRGNYMTYYKTNLHTQPKSDKCVNLLNYKVNPVQHPKSKYAFELISAPKPDKKNNNKHTKSGSFISYKKNYQPKYSPNNDEHDMGNNRYYERTKFILIPDLDVNQIKQREIRDKWVKSLRLATKGAFLWDVLLNLQIEQNDNNNNKEMYDNNNDSQISPKHLTSHSSSYHHHYQSNSQSALTSSSHPHHYNHRDVAAGNQSPLSLSSSQYHHQNKRNQHHHHHMSSGHRKIGGNTQDYPDYSFKK